jgi:hypothetical protein
MRANLRRTGVHVMSDSGREAAAKGMAQAARGAFVPDRVVAETVTAPAGFGVAAIEFALILPVLATLMMGLCDLGEALISDRMMVETAEALVRGANDEV